MPKKQKGNMTVSEMAAMGGDARAKKLTPEERKRLAQQAARARWDKARNSTKEVSPDKK